MSDTKKIVINTDKKELESFWRQHYEDFQKTTLSRAKYCRQNQLAYHRFLYWHDKYNQPVKPKKNKSASSSPNFLPVHLHTAKNSSEDDHAAALCTLELGSDQRLVIHSTKAIELVLNVLRRNGC